MRSVRRNILAQWQVRRARLYNSATPYYQLEHKVSNGKGAVGYECAYIGSSSSTSPEQSPSLWILGQCDPLCPYGLFRTLPVVSERPLGSYLRAVAHRAFPRPPRLAQHLVQELCDVSNHVAIMKQEQLTRKHTMSRVT